MKPWYKIVTPREDLREGKPLDASEFAVHLDQVRQGRGPADYQKPERFFERTYLTKNLTALASEVIRRLSGERTETSHLQSRDAIWRWQDARADAPLPSGEAWPGRESVDGRGNVDRKGMCRRRAQSRSRRVRRHRV
jgi:hypothetical protein